MIAVPMIHPIRLSWHDLIWAVNHDGNGKNEAFDDGFRACLRALGVSEHDIAVLFGEASDEDLSRVS